MRVLAFDTSSAMTAVAVTDGARALARDDRPSEQRHAETLLPRIEAVLASARLRLSDIELLVVGIGPGSFTGLRVGVATAKGLALATKLPLCGVSSLRVLGRGILGQCDVALAVLDAGKGEVFAAAYRAGSNGIETLLEPTRAQPQALARAIAERGLLPANALWCGSGARRYAAAMAEVLGSPPVLADAERDAPSSLHVAADGLAVLEAEGGADPSALEPVYLRGSDAKLPDEPLAL